VYGHGVFFSRAVEDRLGFLDWSPIPAAGLRLVRYDAAGHGRSPGKADPGEYTFERHGANLLALLDHLGADTGVYGIGSSMGGAGLLWAAVTEPARFDRLVVVIPPRAWTDRAASAGMYRDWAELIDREGAGAWRALRAAAAPPPVLADVAGYPPDADIADDVLSSVLRGVASSDLPPLEALSALTQPTLVLAWDDDPRHPVATAERLVATLPNAELAVARTLPEVREWGARAAQFLTADRHSTMASYQ
jgi:3-oxoadipate enol-lactonase